MDSDHYPLILGLEIYFTVKEGSILSPFGHGWMASCGRGSLELSRDIFLSPGNFIFEAQGVEAWNSIETHFCPLETLALKLKALTRALQSWSQKKKVIPQSSSPWPRNLFTSLRLLKTGDSYQTASCGCCTP